jgi:hypothetical protein
MTPDCMCEICGKQTAKSPAPPGLRPPGPKCAGRRARYPRAGLATQAWWVADRPWGRGPAAHQLDLAHSKATRLTPQARRAASTGRKYRR